MTSSRARTLVLVLGLLLCVSTGTALASAATRTAPVLDPGSTRVWAPCAGEPGTMSLTVGQPGSDGRSQVRVVGRHMVEGSHWSIQLGEQDTFRRTARSGSWSVTIPASSQANPPFLDVLAFRTDHSSPSGFDACVLYVETARPAIGGATCHRSFDALTARRRADGTAVLRYLLAGNRPGRRWHVTLSATDVDASQAVTFDSTENRHGVLHSRIILGTGLTRPHFKVLATNAAGRSCRLRFNPAEIDHTGLTTRQLLRIARRQA